MFSLGKKYVLNVTRKITKKKHRDEHIQYIKDYQINNKEKISTYKKKYREENKAQIKQQKKQYEQREDTKELKKIRDDRYKEIHKDKLRLKGLETIQCRCGSNITRYAKCRHEKSKKHLEFLEQI